MKPKQNLQLFLKLMLRGSHRHEWMSSLYRTLQTVTTVGLYVTCRHVFGASVTFGRHLSSLFVTFGCHLWLATIDCLQKENADGTITTEPCQAGFGFMWSQNRRHKERLLFFQKVLHWRTISSNMSTSIPEEKLRDRYVSFVPTHAHSVIPPFSNAEYHDASATELQQAELGDFAKDGFTMT
jgi:hypothetical protein